MAAREPLSPYETWLVATPRQADLHADAITARYAVWHRLAGHMPPDSLALMLPAQAAGAG